MKIDIYGHLWSRNDPFSFTAGPPHRRVAKVEATGEQVSVESGAADRILATSLDAIWRGEADWDAVMKTITDTFAARQQVRATYSISIRHGLGWPAAAQED